MAKKKVFVSFDFDHDKQLKDLIVGQTRNAESPFEVSDHSLKEAAPEKDWENRARAAIAGAEVVILMLGSKTRTAAGVAKEVKMAKELGKPRFQIIGYKDGTEDWAVPDGGRTYRWNWKNLKNLLA